jgi:DNA-directed RNA polymerase subunit K/omega
MTNNISRFALARLIGARALQIAMGAPVMIKLSKEDLERLNYDPIKIAILEYEKGVLPLKAVFRKTF